MVKVYQNKSGPVIIINNVGTTKRNNKIKKNKETNLQIYYINNNKIN